MKFALINFVLVHGPQTMNVTLYWALWSGKVEGPYLTLLLHAANPVINSVQPHRSASYSHQLLFTKLWITELEHSDAPSYRHTRWKSIDLFICHWTGLLTQNQPLKAKVTTAWADMTAVGSVTRNNPNCSDDWTQWFEWFVNNITPVYVIEKARLCLLYPVV